MKTKEVTQQDCVNFTTKVFQLLAREGFHVGSLQEAYLSIESILLHQVQEEIAMSMEESEWES